MTIVGADGVACRGRRRFEYDEATPVVPCDPVECGDPGAREGRS